MNEEDCEYQEKIICPYCGYDKNEPVDLNLPSDYRGEEECEIEEECANCGNYFTLVVHRPWYFSSYKKKDETLA